MRAPNQTDVPVLFYDAIKRVPAGFAIAATTGLLMASSFGATSTIPAEPPASQVRPFLLDTSSTGGATVPLGLERYGRLSAGAESVADLRAMSGLNADQIGQLFGVSRRSVQNWIAGSAMADQHQTRLSFLLATIRPLGSTGAERRRQLLRSANGLSFYHQMVAEVTRPAPIQTTGLTAREQLGA